MQLTKLVDAAQEANTRLVNLYAVVCSGGMTELALLDLRRQHKERLVFDRYGFVYRYFPLFLVCRLVHMSACMLAFVGGGRPRRERRVFDRYCHPVHVPAQVLAFVRCKETRKGAQHF